MCQQLGLFWFGLGFGFGFQVAFYSPLQILHAIVIEYMYIEIREHKKTG